jgi:hypothetical protein
MFAGTLDTAVPLLPILASTAIDEKLFSSVSSALIAIILRDQK